MNLTKLRKDTIKKLQEIKDNLKSWNTQDDYTDIINTLIDYDNNAQDDLYLYDNAQETTEIVDDETLPYYVDYQIKTFGIDRYFYMFNGVDDVCGLYVIDGYGNLRNMEDYDLECMIDNAITSLKEVLQ